MADNKKRLEEMQRLLNEISKVYSSLNENSPFGNDAKNLENSTNQVKILEDSLEGVNQRASVFNSSLNDAFTSFKSIVQEIKKSDNGVKETAKSMNSFSDVARKVRDHQEGISILSVKQIQKEQEKLKSATANLQTNISLLEQQKAQIQEGKKYNELSNKEKSNLTSINESLQANRQVLVGTNTEYNLINSKLKEQEKSEKKIQKDLGVTGGVLKGISKIPILGDVIDADAAVKSMEKTLRAGGSQTKALGAGFKSMGGSLLSALGPANLLVGAITFMIKTLVGADKAAGDYAKSMNMTYDAAIDSRLEFKKMADLSGDVALNSERLQKTSMAVGQALGTNAQLNEADLKTMTKLTNQAGFTADELMNIQKLSLSNGKSLKNNTKEILGGAKEYARRNKIAVNEKTILKEVNNMSASLKLSLGSSGDAMAKAAVQAKKFGINLQQAESIASSLLDFESSIENELSAELLIGRDLNLERARGLALNGDAAGAAAEILKQVGSSAKFGKMNVIQQESIAKAMGMQREELAASLIESEALKSIGVESAEAAQEKYNKLRETMSVEEASKALGDEALASQFEQQSVQEQMADSTAKLSETFIMLTPVLQTIGEAIGVVADVISSIMVPVQWLFNMFGSIGKAISKLIGPLGKVGKILKGVASIAVIYAAYKAYASLATIPIAGVPLGIAAAAAVTAMGFGALSKIKDGAIDPKGGLIVSGEKGSIQLDSEDSIIAGTDLGGKNKPKNNPQQSPGGGNTSVNVDMSQTNALLQQLINVIQSGGSVTLDGQKVGEALKLGSFQTQ